MNAAPVVVAEYLSEVREGPFHIVLIIEAETTHVYGICIHVVYLQHSVRPLRCLAQVALGCTLCTGAQKNEGMYKLRFCIGS